MKNKIRLLILCILIMFLLVSCMPSFHTGVENDKSDTETEAIKKKDSGKKESKKKVDKKTDTKREKKPHSKPHIVLKKVGEESYDDLGMTLYHIEYKYIQLEDDGEEFEPLIAAFEEYNKEVDEQFASTRETFENFAKEEESNRLEGYGEKVFTEETDSYIMRADKDVVSILNYTKYDYGASERYSRNSVSFDTSTGNRLNFLDVVKDDKTFFELVDKRVYEDYEEINIQNPSEYADALRKSNYDNLVWTISPMGVTVYFDTRVLGAETDGPQVITISFEENEEIFNQKYVYEENDYVVPIVAGNMTLHLDVDSDGRSDAIAVNNIYKQNPETLNIYEDGINILVGDQSRELSGYDSKSYIIKKNGNYYMYVFISNEIERLHIFGLTDLDLDNDEFGYLSLGNLYSDWSQNGNIATYESLDETFTDVNSFKGQSMGNLLYLFMISREWFVADDGRLQTNDERGRIIDDRAYKTLVDLKCSVVDENGKVKKPNVTIPADTYILPLYGVDETDAYIDVIMLDESDVLVSSIGEGYGNYIELKNKDLLEYEGDCYRITFDIDKEYGDISIDGKGLFEIFEGLSIAG